MRFNKIETHSLQWDLPGICHTPCICFAAWGGPTHSARGRIQRRVGGRGCRERAAAGRVEAGEDAVVVGRRDHEAQQLGRQIILLLGQRELRKKNPIIVNP
jgi:hypothetical protein